jgi:hypothetical protein
VRTINVRVSVAKVIGLLEKKVVEMKASNATLEEQMKQKEKTEAAWVKGLVQAHVKSTPTSFNFNDRWNTPDGYFELEVNYLIKGKMLEPVVLAPRFNETEIRDVENTIRILKLSEDETVSASTYKNIVQYL